jgi:[ribosomal protein S5]-alanine N-acetyltransferase
LRKGGSGYGEWVPSIRRLVPDDSNELALLLRENRDFLALFDPVRDERFFTSEGQRESIEANSAVRFAIIADGAIVGGVTISDLVYGAFRSAHLGYWVAERLNGRGLATRAVGEAVAVAFGELDLHRLEAGTLVDNLASQRVLDKNRFERIGLARSYLQIAGEWRDHLLYQRTAD